jgi:hypothetical protein
MSVVHALKACGGKSLTVRCGAHVSYPADGFLGGVACVWESKVTCPSCLSRATPRGPAPAAKLKLGPPARGATQDPEQSLF